MRKNFSEKKLFIEKSGCACVQRRCDYSMHTLLQSTVFSLNLQASFLEKNNDALHASLEQLIAVSKDPFIKKLFPEAVKSTGGVNTKKLVLISVGSKFRTQLNGLLEKLRQTVSTLSVCRTQAVAY